MKIWKVVIIVTLAAAVTLGLGIGLPVLADSDEEPRVECKLGSRVLRGTVDTISEDYFTLESNETQIGVNEETRFFRVSVPIRLAALYKNRVTQTLDEVTEQIKAKIRIMPRLQTEAQVRLQNNRQPSTQARIALPEVQEIAPNLIYPDENNERCHFSAWILKWLRRFAEEVEFSDLAVGDKVVVWVAPDEDEPLAKVVLIMTPTSYQRLVGTVNKINEPQQTIEVISRSDTGENITFNYNDSTTFVLRGSPSLEKGDNVSVIYIKENGNLLAKKITELRATDE